MNLPAPISAARLSAHGEEPVSPRPNWPLCLMLRIEMPGTEPDVALANTSAGELQLIVPNLHRRYSGVTATNRMVAPKLGGMFHAAWLGPHAPAGMTRMDAADLMRLWRRR